MALRSNTFRHVPFQYISITIQSNDIQRNLSMPALPYSNILQHVPTYSSIVHPNPTPPQFDPMISSAACPTLLQPSPTQRRKFTSSPLGQLTCGYGWKGKGSQMEWQEVPRWAKDMQLTEGCVPTTHHPDDYNALFHWLVHHPDFLPDISDPTCSKLIADLFHQFRPMLINIIHFIPRQHGIQHYPMTHKSISRRFQPKPFSPTLHSIQP